MRFFSLFIFFSIYTITHVLGQYNAGGTQFYIGPLAGINVARYSPGKNLLNVPEAYKTKVGYSAGVMYKFKINESLSLHGEFNYTRKTRSVEDSIKTTAFKNSHIDAPILFELSFPAKNKYIGEFQYYFNIGPQISYWLKGNGITRFKGDSSMAVEYPIDFRPNQTSILTNDQVNRFQYGFNLGSGLTLPSVGDNYFVVELRYSFCQTYLGDKYSAEMNGNTINDDLRGNYHVLALNVSYTFGVNFLPKTQNNSGMKVKTVVK